jgi:hypothetical protein
MHNSNIKKLKNKKVGKEYNLLKTNGELLLFDEINVINNNIIFIYGDQTCTFNKDNRISKGNRNYCLKRFAFLINRIKNDLNTIIESKVDANAKSYLLAKDNIKEKDMNNTNINVKFDAKANTKAKANTNIKLNSNITNINNNSSKIISNFKVNNAFTEVIISRKEKDVCNLLSNYVYKTVSTLLRLKLNTDTKLPNLQNIPDDLIEYYYINTLIQENNNSNNNSNNHNGNNSDNNSNNNGDNNGDTISLEPLKYIYALFDIKRSMDLLQIKFALTYENNIYIYQMIYYQ